MLESTTSCCARYARPVRRLAPWLVRERMLRRKSIPPNIEHWRGLPDHKTILPTIQPTISAAAGPARPTHAAPGTRASHLKRFQVGSNIKAGEQMGERNAETTCFKQDFHWRNPFGLESLPTVPIQKIGPARRPPAARRCCRWIPQSVGIGSRTLIVCCPTMAKTTLDTHDWRQARLSI